MNILILTYQGDVAGSTYSISYLAKGLADKGHNVYVGCRKASVLYSLLDGTKVNLVPMKFLGKVDLLNMWAIYRLVMRHNIEIINAQSSLDRYTAGLSKLLFRYKAKVIHTRRQMPLSDGFAFQRWFYVKSTACIVAVSASVKQGLVDLGMPDDHVHVILNGTPKGKYLLPDLDQQIALLRSKYGLMPNDTVIGCVARRKDQHHLLQALNFIEKPLKVLLVGIAADQELLQIVQSSEYKHEVIFTGEMDTKHALYHHKLLNIAVMPSTTEGLSQSLLESMAMGVPVIATNYAGNKDLITHGKNGLLYENNDLHQLSSQISLLLHDDQLREHLIAAGYKTALEDFEIGMVIKNYEDLFAEIIKKGH